MVKFLLQTLWCIKSTFPMAIRRWKQRNADQRESTSHDTHKLSRTRSMGADVCHRRRDFFHFRVILLKQSDTIANCRLPSGDKRRKFQAIEPSACRSLSRWIKHKTSMGVLFLTQFPPPPHPCVFRGPNF